MFGSGDWIGPWRFGEISLDLSLIIVGRGGAIGTLAVASIGNSAEVDCDRDGT